MEDVDGLGPSVDVRLGATASLSKSCAEDRHLD
jgi:hypothetical protein